MPGLTAQARRGHAAIGKFERGSDAKPQQRIVRDVVEIGQL
jgi:hypothetical protein